MTPNDLFRDFCRELAPELRAIGVAPGNESAAGLQLAVCARAKNAFPAATGVHRDDASLLIRRLCEAEFSACVQEDEDPHLVMTEAVLRAYVVEPVTAAQILDFVIRLCCHGVAETVALEARRPLPFDCHGSPP